MPTIFTKILAGEIPAHKVLENEKYLAFLDIRPVNPGHTLVIPKQEIDYIFDMEDKDYSWLMLASKKVSELLKKKINSKRIGVLVEGFGVDHVHVHLVPIDNGGQVCLQYSKHASNEELDKVVKKILS